MSVVYRARDLATGELVALKMMSYRLIYDVQALVRFQHEADLLQELEHPNIARLKRLFPAYRTYFLVMELCDGADLQRLLISRGALPESEVRAILGQLAEALDFVHQHGVIHRDLKPANVMITRDGHVKLTDFGVASPASPLAGRTRTADHALVGTPAFMSPVQLDGDTLDSRTDIYSLGCLTYELLTARRLFTSTSLFGLVQEKSALTLPSASEIGGGISAEMHEFLERSLQVNRQERLSSVAPLIKWAARCEPPPEDVVEAQRNAGATPVFPDTQAITRAD
jgi:serine/threonine-protein kinase